jgi:hypothetical protein
MTGMAAADRLRDLLEKQGVKGTGDVYDLDGWQLHTHPDLCDRLRALNPHCYRGVYGVPVLSTEEGAIFAVAMGTSLLALRLPEAEAVEAATSGGRGWTDGGDEWLAVEPWSTDESTLKRWCRAAQKHANSIKE